MNSKIRSILIEQARKGEPIVYSKLMNLAGLKHQMRSDRLENSIMLYEISKFEFENQRPLLSSVAMYAEPGKGHGGGFCEVGEELGFGPKKKLEEDFFPILQMNECFAFWKDDANYDNFAVLNTAKSYMMSFFEASDISFLHQWGGKVYDKSDKQHVSAKNYIMSTLGSKTVYWSNELIKDLPGFETFNWRMWSQKGWDNTPAGKVRVARFKTYTWARIYKKGDEYKDIFFTVGADGSRDQLVYKLDYYFENSSALTAKQKAIIEANIPTELRWKSIPVTDLQNWDWNKLIILTRTFISEHAHVYDRLIQLAWGISTPEQVFNNMLRKKNPPTGISVLPAINPTFKGVDIDFAQLAIEHKDIGDAGEELVKQYEKARLNASNLPLLADKVKIVPDGSGYDILSFDLNSNPIYIEVKTTSGDEKSPFYYTINEYLFAEKHPGNYVIYRLYNLDDDTNTADFYTINKPFDQLLFQPTTYKVYYKG